MGPQQSHSKIFNRLVIIAGLGYFVDVYDLVLFVVVRIESLNELGVTGDAALDTGVFLLNMQMSGMLLGGFLWGMLGDKRGRLSTLFGAIALYSLANLANAFVTTVPQYAAIRFIAGVGLAGELGAGVTLVSEAMPKHLRGYGVMIVTSLGIMGAVAAEIVSQFFSWRIAYAAGGIAGLLLLFTQASVAETRAFDKLKELGVSRGDLRLLFFSRERLTTYVHVILVGVPVWYTIAVLITFSPELSVQLGLAPGALGAGAMIAWNYGGAALGGVFFGILSERMRSRKWVLIIALAVTAALMYAFVFAFGAAVWVFYALSFLLGFGTGYWPVFLTTAAEHFGTNLRATVTTTVPNFVRGAVVPTTLAFTLLARAPGIGLVKSAMIVGAVIMLLALWATRNLKETYGRDLDFLESATATPPLPATSLPTAAPPE